MDKEKEGKKEKTIVSNIWKYKYLVDVIENKSFTKAGNLNYVSQIAISQNISSLEKSMGGKLIDRGSGELRPTELGEIVYRNARQILEIEKKMFGEVEDFQNRSLIWVGIDSSINKKLWLTIENVYETNFLETYNSGKGLMFTRVDCAVAASMLKSNELDVFIGYGTAILDQVPGVKSEKLEARKVGIYVGKHTTIPYGTVRLEELKGHRHYKTAKYSVSIQEEAEDYLRGSCPVSDVKNVETMKVMVEFNDGFAFVDSYYFYRDDGEICSLVDYEKECEVRMYCKTDCKKKDARLFMKKLKEKMKV